MFEDTATRWCPLPVQGQSNTDWSMKRVPDATPKETTGDKRKVSLTLLGADCCYHLDCQQIV